jgi:hypothetical protein
MADTSDSLEIGDRVITLQMPGIFRVVARNGRILTIDGEKNGVRLQLHEAALRRPMEASDVAAPAADDDGTSAD